MNQEPVTANQECQRLNRQIMAGRDLIIVSNRGPVTFGTAPDGSPVIERGSGGLVTALVGLARQTESTWISSPISAEDRAFNSGKVDSGEDSSFCVSFINPEAEAYDGYYNAISNPLLWFLQHSMWDFARSPTINSQTWEAWNEGYVVVNRLFAEAVARQIRANQNPTLVMLQDYHLYLAPAMIRRQMKRSREFILSLFVHIPWPGPEDWAYLPAGIRQPILEGLCAADMLGFQTRNDALNFIRTCETLLPAAHVNYRRGRIWYHNHAVAVRDFPISIDVPTIRAQAASEETAQFGEQLDELARDRQLIVRIDRTEPSKNIVRGFQAYEEMLDLYPEHREKVLFLAILVPSRLEVEEYKNYLDELMAAAGRVNARWGNSGWEPVRVLVGESYPRALAALQRYDVLLVNPVADGMNLVCKEGAIINENDGALILSERAGAHQQLGRHALVVSPLDVYATAQALHQALVMPASERHRRAQSLRESVEDEDIVQWLCWQLEEINNLFQRGHHALA